MNKCIDYENCKSKKCRNCQRNAKLRVCARCEWIFKRKSKTGCPKCEFASYGARFVYGDKCYKYMISQEPWMKRKIDEYRSKLLSIIERTNPIKLKEKPVLYKSNYENY